MDDSGLKKQVQSGEKAKRLLDSHANYWKDVEADIWRLWRNTQSADKEGREDLYREYHAIQAIKARITKVVNQGIKAAEELEQRKQHAN